MIEITDKKNCSGCNACASICPKGCIRMEADEEGFLYPIVEESRCVHCDLCDLVCPVQHPATENSTVEAKAVQNKDENIRQSSSSGGVFTELACYVLRQGGVVFGAAFDDGFRVRHICVDTEEDLHRLRGSKYVQSEIGDTYHQAQQYLQESKVVLFTGTPCQINGLYNFLGGDKENLLTQDIICHGVPSPMVWERYVQYREKLAGEKTHSVTFRNKRQGWRRYSLQFAFCSGKSYSQVLSEDPYLRGFLRNICLRPSCHACVFKTKSRPSDITLADFWGVEQVLPEMDDNRGTSLVLLHSEKGKNVFQQIENGLQWKNVDMEKCIIYNSALVESVSENPNRALFMQTVRTAGFETAVSKYLRLPLMQRVRRVLKKMVFAGDACHVSSERGRS